MIEKTLQRIYRTIRGIGPSGDDRSSADRSQIRPTDTFIVSYPKSGNTWVRFLLANALYPSRTINFHTIHELIPEIGASSEGHAGDLPASPRLWKSHSLYQASYPRVIYVVRDGRDVYTSYYHYQSHNLPDGTTFKAFVRNENVLWPSTWSDHVSSWLGDPVSPDDDVLVVHFEDLKSDAHAQLRRMVRFLDIDLPSDVINQAVDASSFDRMRELEQEEGRRYTDVKQFMRSGEKGDWQSHFTAEVKEVFKQREGDVLQQLGYVEDANW